MQQVGFRANGGGGGPPLMWLEGLCVCVCGGGGGAFLDFCFIIISPKCLFSQCISFYYGTA